VTNDLRRFLLLGAALIAVGCAAHGPGTVDTPDVASEPTASAPAGDADLGPSAEPVAEPATETDEAEALADEVLAEAEAYGPEDLQPGEEVSESPLDELARVTPELDHALYEPQGPEAPDPPEFDIPIVVNDQVSFWLDYYADRHRDSFRPGLVRSGRYMDLFREIFEEEGLPLDLIYMAHVESAYKTTAYSRARAAGIFQFIASTARLYGLRIDYWVDERRDPEKSARAATAYLKKLYGDFGDWYLAMAAYNAGEGKVKRALARSGHDDFWGIARTRYIRRETKNYVPAIIAATLISKEPEKYGFVFDPDPAIVYDTIEVEGAVDLQVLADCAGSDFESMRALNPALRRNQTPPHATTAVRVPRGSAERTLAALAEVPEEERVLYVRHRVRRGDTLYDLARAYGVTVGAIQTANQMGRRTMIREGKELVIPTVAAGKYSDRAPSRTASAGTSGQVLTYRVRRGDTLYGIARRYGTTAHAIAAVSHIHVNDLLHPGDRLKVVVGARSSAEARRIVQAPAATTVAAAANGASASSDAVVYTVRRGDSLWRIASRHRTTVRALCAWNQISEHGVLHPGTQLTVGFK
jgi:membrane-bound lytic murein transglycosylase D